MSQFPLPVNLVLEIEGFLAKLEVAKKAWSESGLNAGGSPGGGGTDPSGKSVMTPGDSKVLTLPMQKATLGYVGGPHNWSPTVSGANGAGFAPPTATGSGAGGVLSQGMFNLKTNVENYIRMGIPRPAGSDPNQYASAIGPTQYMTHQYKAAIGPEMPTGQTRQGANSNQYGSAIGPTAPGFGSANGGQMQGPPLPPGWTPSFGNLPSQGPGGGRGGLFQRIPGLMGGIRAIPSIMALHAVSSVVSDSQNEQDIQQSSGTDSLSYNLGRIKQRRVGASSAIDPLGIGYGDALAGTWFGQRQRDVQDQIYGRAENERRRGAYLQAGASATGGIGSRFSVSPYAGSFQSNQASRESELSKYSTYNEEITKRQPGADFLKTTNEFTMQRNLANQNADYNDAGIRGRMFMDIDVQDASNTGSRLKNRLRPGEGAARQKSLSGIAIFNAENADTDLFESKNPSSDADVKRMRELSIGKLRGSYLDIQGDQTDMMRNVYGGRPTEINGLQSVEAMRDISPETLQDALAANTAALKAVADALATKGAVP